MDKDYLVVKKNIFNSGKFEITFSEYRIILLALSKINPKINNYKNIEFTIQEFANIFNDTNLNKGLYSCIRTLCKTLLSRVIELDLEDKTTMFQWFSKVDLPYNSNVVYISFSDEIAPFITWLIENTNYTKYMLSNITKFNSFYSIRIYELLKEYEFKKIRTIDLIELREILGLKKSNKYKSKYPLYANFKKRVLITAQEELIQSSDIYFSFEEIKEGRKVTAIKFIIIKNNKIHNTEFKKNNKFEIIAVLNKLLAEKLSIRINTSKLSEFHRFVLIDLLYYMRETEDFGFVKIPKSFIFSKLNEFTEKYDLSSIVDY